MAIISLLRLVISSNNLLRARQKEDELPFVLYLVTPIYGLGGLFCVDLLTFYSELRV